MATQNFSLHEHRKMNMPPETFIRVPHKAMEVFVAEVGSAAGQDDQAARGGYRELRRCIQTGSPSSSSGEDGPFTSLPKPA